MNTIDLSAFFQTKAQANDFSSRVASLSEKLYETEFHLEKTLMELFGLKKKEAFMTLLREHTIAPDDNTAMKTFLTEIQHEITTLPILSLTLPFEPNDQTLKKLSEWFLFNSNKQVLFEYHFDSKLIAGAAISFNGKNADYSIREKFNVTLQKILAETTPTTENAKPA